MSHTPADIQAQLRRAIMESDMSRYRLAQLTGVSQATLSLFVHNKRSVTMDIAAKLARELGLELTPIKGPKKGR